MSLALEILQISILSHTDSAEVVLALQHAIRKNGDFTEAKKLLELSLTKECFKLNVKLWIQNIQLQRQLGQQSEALTVVKKTLEVDKFKSNYKLWLI